MTKAERYTKKHARHVARTFDRCAAALRAAGCYRNADAWRDTAQVIRDTARINTNGARLSRAGNH